MNGKILGSQMTSVNTFVRKSVPRKSVNVPNLNPDQEALFENFEKAKTQMRPPTIKPTMKISAAYMGSIAFSLFLSDFT